MIGIISPSFLVLIAEISVIYSQIVDKSPEGLIRDLIFT